MQFIIRISGKISMVKSVCLTINRDYAIISLAGRHKAVKDIIFLIGFMGTGKSTIAEYMRQNYGRAAVEMDEVIEEREGMTIPRIFEEKGEAYFRELETELLQELSGRENLVVSCGGGVPLRACNVELMRRSGTVVFLTASPETVYQRVKNSHNRPLLEKNKNIPFIASLMEERRERYENAADLLTATDGRSAEEICREIMEGISQEIHKADDTRLVRRSNAIDEVMVITSIDKANLPILRLCADMGVRVGIGSENDVLDRYYQNARLLNPEYVIRLTGDCPCIDHGLIDQAISQMPAEIDYCSNTIETTFADGLSCT